VSSLLARVFVRDLSDTVPLERRCTGFAGVRRAAVVGYKTGAPRKLNARQPGDEDADHAKAMRLVPTENSTRASRHELGYNLAPRSPD
jgi:hypothetical protein